VQPSLLEACQPESGVIEQEIYDRLRDAVDRSEEQRKIDLKRPVGSIREMVIRKAGAERRHHQRCLVAAELAMTQLEAITGLPARPRPTPTISAALRARRRTLRR